MSRSLRNHLSYQIGTERENVLRAKARHCCWRFDMDATCPLSLRGPVRGQFFDHHRTMNACEMERLAGGTKVPRSLCGGMHLNFFGRRRSNVFFAWWQSLLREGCNACFSASLAAIHVDCHASLPCFFSILSCRISACLLASLLACMHRSLRLLRRGGRGTWDVGERIFSHKRMPRGCRKKRSLEFHVGSDEEQTKWIPRKRIPPRRRSVWRRAR